MSLRTEPQTAGGLPFSFSFHPSKKKKCTKDFTQFVQKVQSAYKGGKVETGQFGANMQVEIVNDGPVTMSLSTDDLDLSKEREKIDRVSSDKFDTHSSTGQSNDK